MRAPVVCLPCCHPESAFPHWLPTSAPSPAWTTRPSVGGGSGEPQGVRGPLQARKETAAIALMDVSNVKGQPESLSGNAPPRAQNTHWTSRRTAGGGGETSTSVFRGIQ